MSRDPPFHTTRPKCFRAILRAYTIFSCVHNFLCVHIFCVRTHFFCVRTQFIACVHNFLCVHIFFLRAYTFFACVHIFLRAYTIFCAYTFFFACVHNLLRTRTIFCVCTCFLHAYIFIRVRTRLIVSVHNFRERVHI